MIHSTDYKLNAILKQNSALKSKIFNPCFNSEALEKTRFKKNKKKTELIVI